MDRIGIFFGTDSGTTRLIAKKIAKQLGDVAAKPLNVNRVTLDDVLQYDALILGTPTYGQGVMPGIETGVKQGSWQEWAAQVAPGCFAGKTVALYGLGDQEKYPDHFVDGLWHLHALLDAADATIVGDWSTDGYQFAASKAVVDDRFLGLVIDNSSQGALTDQRIESWLAAVTPLLIAAVERAA